MSHVRASTSTISRKKALCFACNAVYRTHQPHWLVAVDPKMMLEIAETDYVVHNKVYSNYNRQYEKHQKLLDHVTWSKPSLGWSSGPTALRLACEQGFKEIYILGLTTRAWQRSQQEQIPGQQHIQVTQATTRRSNEQATFFGNWMNQTKKCLQDFKDVQFHRVIPTGWYQPKDLAWKGNIDHPSTEEFLDKFNLTR